MTLSTIQSLTDSELRKALAEALGMTDINTSFWTARPKLEGYSAEDVQDGGIREVVPDWPGSLDAVHEAEEALVALDLKDFRVWRIGKYPAVLQEVCGGGVLGCFNHLHATARQRSEALLCVLQRP